MSKRSQKPSRTGTRSTRTGSPAKLSATSSPVAETFSEFCSELRTVWRLHHKGPRSRELHSAVSRLSTLSSKLYADTGLLEADSRAMIAAFSPSFAELDPLIERDD
jgi:hypothetical protein